MDMLVSFLSNRALEPMPLSVKSYHFELIETDEHDNANFK